MISARAVNLSHIGGERPTGALVASTYRRSQRFFQHGPPRALGPDWSLDLEGSGHLAPDRTQRQVGARDVNFLMPAPKRRRAAVVASCAEPLPAGRYAG